jgi:hypothetical protein
MIKYVFWIIVFVILGCKKTQAPVEKTGLDNRFFTLDLTRPGVTMQTVSDRFFTTFPHDDPTNGDVVYDRNEWENKNIVEMRKGDGLYLHIKARATDKRFDSFRLTSKSYFNINTDDQQILFVFKGRLPSGRGIWPAWWLNGSFQEKWLYHQHKDTPSDADLDRYSGVGRFFNTPSPVNGTDWPAAGELDIIETINGDSLIHNTLHTCPQMCDAEWNSNGKIINCANAKNGDPNAGCSGEPYAVSEPAGTWACLWEKQTIRFYYWPADAEVRQPGGPLSEAPDPSAWNGLPLKNTVKLLETDTPCKDAEHQDWQCANCKGHDQCVLSNMKMIFNATICGKWAGNRFDQTAAALQNCQSFITNEGRDMIDNQYMKIEYVAVVQL